MVTRLMRGAVLGETVVGPLRRSLLLFTCWLLPSLSSTDRFLVAACAGLMLVVLLCTWRE
jgi:hypothetical protein